jgi:hypothetical protein
MSRSGMPSEQVAQIMSEGVEYIAQLIDEASRASAS